jgi:hypothetical protein
MGERRMEENKEAKYKKGQILVAKMDLELELSISGEKEVIKKGSKAIVGFDGDLHHYNGMIQGFADDVKIEGYSGSGLTEYIYDRLNGIFQLDDMLEDYEITKERFCDELVYILDDIGISE